VETAHPHGVDAFPTGTARADSQDKTRKNGRNKRKEGKKELKEGRKIKEGRKEGRKMGQSVNAPVSQLWRHRELR
jgi:hypothetical protein